MATYNFEGDVNNISDNQLEFINNTIIELGFTKSKVIFEPVGKAGDNYVASVKRIIVKGENGGLSMIAKITPPAEDSGDANDMRNIATSILFKNEHLMYMEVLPKFVQLQKSVGVPEEEQLKYEKCYGSSIEPSHEIILLEDLNLLDFTMLDKFQPLSNDCVKSFLKNFAIFHSLSFAMKQIDPETFNSFKTRLFNMLSFYASFPEMEYLVKGLETEMKAVLEDENHKKHINMTEYRNSLPKFATLESESKYSIIVQGDAWTNNIMYKLNNDVVEDSIMIDYQLSRLGCPVCDILYMIFNCTEYETRRLHYHDWIDYYHAELDKSLFNFNLKANFVYPRDKLDADLKLYSKVMFGSFILTCSFIIRKPEDAEKLTNSMRGADMEEGIKQMSTVSNLDDETTTLLRSRIVGLINSCVEFGLL